MRSRSSTREFQRHAIYTNMAACPRRPLSTIWNSPARMPLSQRQKHFIWSIFAQFTGVVWPLLVRFAPLQRFPPDHKTGRCKRWAHHVRSIRFLSRAQAAMANVMRDRPRLRPLARPRPAGRAQGAWGVGVPGFRPRTAGWGRVASS
jgi:hypothetical protein